MYDSSNSLQNAVCQNVIVVLACSDILLHDPPIGCHVRFLHFVRQDTKKLAGLWRGDNTLAVILQISVIHKSNNNSRSRCGCSDRAILSLLAFILLLEERLDFIILDILGNAGHIGNKRVLRISHGRLRLFLHHARVEDVALIGSNRDCAQGALLVTDTVLFEECQVSHLDDFGCRSAERTPIFQFDSKCRALFLCGRHELCHVILADGEVTLAFRFRHCVDIHADILRDNGRVRFPTIRRILIVEALGFQSHIQLFRAKPNVADNGIHCGTGFGILRFREVLAVGTVVGNSLVLLTQGLGNFHNLLRFVAKL